jgi:hypothetical protein
MPKSLKSEEEAAADANAVSQDIYQEYRDYISDTKKGIKSLLDGKQLQQMELKEYVPSETPLERNTGNIFTKPF